MDNPRPASSEQLGGLWDFKCNWRDLAGTSPSIAMPLASADRKLEAAQFESRDPSSPDYLRPIPDSPLASAGAGNEDPSLPSYVGAVPPKGVDPWDWRKTWDSRRPGSSASE
jgi:hypothetical protein